MGSTQGITLQDNSEGLHCDIPVFAGISAGISLAKAGDMALSGDRILPWRARLLERLGIRQDKLYGLRQVHSRRIQHIDVQHPEDVAAIEADGLITTRPDAVLSVTVADCLPIFLADQRTGAFGIVHSGWRGTGIVLEALAFMRSQFGSQPAEITAVIGPGIGACCYMVPEERVALFSTGYGSEAIKRDKGGAARLDLRAANTHLLESVGVREVRVVTDCTGCSHKLGSFRRQGPLHFTRMLAWIGKSNLLTAM
jgi:YfiH family protein